MTLAASQNLLSNGMTLERWAALMVTAFPHDDIPQLLSEEDWRSWGAQLVQELSFEKAECPSPLGFETLDLWVNACEMSLANNSNL